MPTLDTLVAGVPARFSLRKDVAEQIAMLGRADAFELTNREPLPPTLLGLCRAFHLTPDDLKAATVAARGAATPSIFSQLCGVECTWLSSEASGAAIDMIAELLHVAMGAAVSQAVAMDNSDVEEALGRYEEVAEDAKATDCTPVGGGEYATSARGCQLACVGSQLMVLLAAMDALESVQGAEDDSE